jgi:hypothetical protein
MRLTFPISGALEALAELRDATACRTLYDVQTGKTSGWSAIRAST